MEDVDVPVFYAVSRDLPKAQATAILDALRITPIELVIVSRVEDADLAFALSPSVLRKPNDEQAQDTAWELAESGCRALIVGDAPLLDAYYEDGHKEPVATQC